ncbi:DDE-type integrase/transposase/recombinase [Streptobacillus canis]|uniref:DDE-type integrase/transposase/recombinase n=1 Tax=Streptobacillus canis TaxID=2678686 RepID=UPI0012E2F7F9|nr:DDE-type integrase/transposase/recombinase [Streptobacillus canis]
MKYAGELIQMDASKHDWFCNGTYAHLHIAIDDHSRKILSAYFYKEETLRAYYQITHDMIVNYGIPYSILTNKRTVFEYKNKSNKSIENDTFTQYGYACHRLGIDLKTTSIPQAKGRVERAFSTLQSRLVNELRINNINNINNIESANMFLPQFIEAFNNKFSTDINNTSMGFLIIKIIEFILNIILMYLLLKLLIIDYLLVLMMWLMLKLKRNISHLSLTLGKENLLLGILRKIIKLKIISITFNLKVPNY